MKGTERRLSALIVLLALPTHLIGILWPSIYRDPAILLPQNLGTDLVTLCVGIPLLIVGAIAMGNGSARGRLLWLGALAYLVYAYGMYALAVRWNVLFLAYLALFGLSLYALILGFKGTDAERIHTLATARLPIRSVAAYLLFIALVVGAMWLAEEVRATVQGTVPPTVTQFETPTNIVHVFDLAIVLPAMVVAAVLVLRRHPWGTVLSGTLLVKAATIGLWVAIMIWLSARQGYESPAAYTAVFLLLAAVGAALTWWYLARLEPGV